MAHACNPSTLGGRGRRVSEFEASLVYRVSSRTATAIQRNPVSKKPNPRNKQTKKNPLNILKKYLFLVLFKSVRVYLCRDIYTHACRGLQSAEEYVGPLEWELQAAVNRLRWGLGINRGPLEEQCS